jgi:transketolase
MILSKGFKEEELTAPMARYIKRVAKQVRGDVIRMAMLSGGGPVGGSLSVAEVLLTLISSADLDPSDPEAPGRDRILVSHEYAVPTFYAALGRLDFFDLDDAVCLFKKAGSIFEGRLERSVPGVEWNCGVPGQGLSAACGQALAARWYGNKPNIFVVMSDEEQQNGQIAEARRFAKKYRLNNITTIVDANNVQHNGKTSEVMPQNLKHEFIADGWDVIEINGHDPSELYQAVRRATQIQSTPVLVLANTMMGSGVSFMENQHEFYSRGLTHAEYEEALRELGESTDLAESNDYRSAFGDFDVDIDYEPTPFTVPEVGTPITYGVKERLTNVQAFGKALADVGNANRETENPIVVFDCAHAHELELAEFIAQNHEKFIQSGLGNHSCANVAAAMSAEGVATILADYGTFAIEEIYQQLRLADINRANLKVVATRLGLDSGSDGKVMHCLNYIGMTAGLFGFKLILPADANQTDRALRYMMQQPGNWILGMGRSETPVITDGVGKPLFGGDYNFEYGEITEVRPGEGGVIISTGQMLPRAIEAWSILNHRGVAPMLLNASCPLSLIESEDPLFLGALRKGRVITLEDHNATNGLGMCVADVIAKKGVSCRLMKLGVSGYAPSGTPEDLYKSMGLDVEHFVGRVAKFLKR